MPLGRLRWSWRGIQWQLIVGLVCLPVGVLAAGWIRGMGATFLLLALVGGFAFSTSGVATGVAFAHRGAGQRLERFNLWLTGAALLILVGLAARVSADFLPGIQATHYLYGAGCWIVGAGGWAACVLPRVLR